uniref:Vestigial-like family member 2b n=1 Tax=Paramormyrops kingsleyae TaxID=1676925 RepID=A0A3B3S760_9TELE
MQKGCEAASGTDSGSKSASGAASVYPVPHGEEDEQKEKREEPEAEYLSSRCILFTYYRGDISSVVDEHFSRALSAYMEGESKRHNAAVRADHPTLSGRRNFPPSFWDSNYPSAHSRLPPEGAAPYPVDPYSPSLHPGLPHPHPHPHPAETWGYAQGQTFTPAQSLHELYTPAGLEPHYSPLLMPAIRPAHLPTLAAHYDVGKLDGAPSWPGLLQPGDMAQTLALNMDPGAHTPTGLNHNDLFIFYNTLFNNLKHHFSTFTSPQ